jgi:hypothetical protein
MNKTVELIVNASAEAIAGCVSGGGSRVDEIYWEDVFRR